MPGSLEILPEALAGANAERIELPVGSRITLAD